MTSLASFVRPALAPLALALGLTALAGCASQPATPSGPTQVREGVLTGTNGGNAGMTLYTFDRDVSGSGKSVCNGMCATNWPPLLLAAGATPVTGADWSVVVRDDGARQYAYKGKPLYFWAKDKNPGDKTGDNFNSVWHAAKP